MSRIWNEVVERWTDPRLVSHVEKLCRSFGKDRKQVLSQSLERARLITFSLKKG